MKNISKTTAVWTRGLAFVTAFSLCACSVLNIDVDEYKGPLSNHEDVQLQQYAALAISAKPIIVELRSRYISDEKDKDKKIHDQNCEKNNYDEYSGCRFELEIAQFLDSILALYEDETGTLQKKATEYTRANNLAIIQRLISIMEQDKIYFFTKNKRDKQNSKDIDLKKFYVYKRQILDSKTLSEQQQLEKNLGSEQQQLEKNLGSEQQQLETDLGSEQKKLTQSEHYKQVNLTKKKLDELNSFIIYNSTLVKQPKTRGTQETNIIKNFSNTKKSSTFDFEKSDCITQKNSQSNSDARDACGINRLTMNFIDSINKASVSPEDNNLKNEVRVAKERLNESLILFAEKILFIVNNHGLAFGNGTTNYDDSANNHDLTSDNGTTNYDKPTTNGYARKFAVLQSLGNTLIVYANDLRRRAEHDQRLVDRKDSELAAAQQAFAPGAQSAFDNLVGDLGAAIQEKGNKEANLQSAINAFPKTDITEESIALLRRELIADAKKVQPKLDAYRTVFNDYNFKVEGIISVDSLAGEDRREIANLFKQVDPKVKMDAVLTKLKSWFDDESKTTPQGVLQPSDSKYDRRKNAKTVLGDLMLSEQDLKDAGTETEIFMRLGDKLLVGLNEDKPNLEDRQRMIADNKQALDTYNKNTSELSKSTKVDLKGVIEAIKSIKQVVLQHAETARVVDLSGLRNLLLLELKKQDELTAEPNKKIKFQAAHDMLAEMSIPKSFQFVGGSSVKTQRDVLDDVIAQLQHQRLEAASRGGDITALNNALALAFEQRGGLAYLRSATAYLRNAFANTSLQAGNDSCRNLLTPSIFCQDGYDRVFKQTKLEIDKQFWQTINTIKVRGGGATDFAIVKDDVGNWYVKGLSSDPESIIKSAQSLALFNMGGKVNLNLLGQVEDRRELAKLKFDDPKREYLQDKLDSKQSGSGANTTALGKVLDKYRKEYVDSTTKDVDGLIGKLDQLPTDITAAWQDINFGDTKEANLAKLKGLLGTPAELDTAEKALKAAKVDLALAAAPTTQASSTAKDISEAANIRASDDIVKSLIEVRNMRSRLVKAIIQNDDLIATQRGKYEVEMKNFNDKEAAVTVLKNDWEKANANVTDAQARYDAMTEPTAVAKKRKALDDAEQALEVAQGKLNEAHTAQEVSVADKRKTWNEAVELRKSAQLKAEAENSTAADLEALAKAKITLEQAEKTLDSAINIPSQDVIARTKERDKAESDRKIQQGIFEGLTASSEVASSREKLNAAIIDRDIAKNKWETANSELVNLRASAKGKEDAYTLAKSNRLAAARKVTMLANSLIEITTANRLEAVKAYEVAIGFVGQTAGGQ